MAAFITSLVTSIVIVVCMAIFILCFRHWSWYDATFDVTGTVAGIAVLSFLLLITLSCQYCSSGWRSEFVCLVSVAIFDCLGVIDTDEIFICYFSLWASSVLSFFDVVTVFIDVLVILYWLQKWLMLVASCIVAVFEVSVVGVVDSFVVSSSSSIFRNYCVVANYWITGVFDP